MSKQPSKAIEEVPYFGPILGSKRGASDTLHRSSGGVAAVGRDEELVVVTKDEPTLRFDYDVGVGERAFAPFRATRRIRRSSASGFMRRTGD